MAVTLYILVEGDTEERYANQVLAPHLSRYLVYAEVSRVITRGRRGKAEAKGGGRTYRRWKNDLATWIKQQGHRKEVWFTTMLDLYGLSKFGDGFPGYREAQAVSDPYARVRQLEQAWRADIAFERFLPHLQLHEFEAMILVDPTVLKDIFVEEQAGAAAIAAEVQATGQQPEQINEGDATAPSKRIVRHIPQYQYQKATAGPQAAQRIGLARIQTSCPHFRAWLSSLEQLRA